MFRKITYTKTIKSLLLLSIAAVIFSALLVVFYRLKNKSSSDLQTSIKPGNISINSQKKYWRNQIRQKGPQKAYLRYKKEAVAKTPQDQHLAGHIIGELLFEQRGVDSLIICDNSSGFSCFHGFFTAAINKLGPSGAKKLYAVCIKQYGSGGTGCQHGIGHGILEFFGYSKLSQALSICEELPSPHPLLGCVSGVFMDYNFPTIIHETETSTTLRSVDQFNLNHPCDIVEQKFQPSCYFELIAWLVKALPFEPQKIISLCDKLKFEANRKSCFLGLGFNLLIDYKNADKSFQTCQTIEDKNSQISCLAGATWASYVFPGFNKLSNYLCNYLQGSEKELCFREANISGESDYRKIFKTVK